MEWHGAPAAGVSARSERVRCSSRRWRCWRQVADGLRMAAAATPSCQQQHHHGRAALHALPTRPPSSAPPNAAPHAPPCAHAAAPPAPQTFIKTVNYQHLMPTRYTLEVDLKGVVTPDCVDNTTKKVEANKEAKALLEDKFKSGKNR